MLTDISISTSETVTTVTSIFVHLWKAPWPFHPFPCHQFHKRWQLQLVIGGVNGRTVRGRPYMTSALEGVEGGWFPKRRKKEGRLWDLCKWQARGGGAKNRKMLRALYMEAPYLYIGRRTWRCDTSQFRMGRWYTNAPWFFDSSYDCHNKSNTNWHRIYA